MIPSQVTQDLEDTLIPLMLVRSTLFHPAQEKGHRVHEMVVSSPVELTFNETATHAKATANKHHRTASGKCILDGGALQFQGCVDL